MQLVCSRKADLQMLLPFFVCHIQQEEALEVLHQVWDDRLHFFDLAGKTTLKMHSLCDPFCSLLEPQDYTGRCLRFYKLNEFLVDVAVAVTCI